MSYDQILALDDARAFEATHRFEDLALFHVEFDRFTPAEGTEAILRRMASSRGRVAVIGPSGSGKSSLMTHVLGPFAEGLPEGLIPLRIPVGGEADETVSERVPFVRHVIGTLLYLASPEALTEHQRTRIEQNLAGLPQRAGREVTRSYSLGTPIWLANAQIAREVRTATAALPRSLSTADAIHELQLVVDLFRAHDTEPFLVFDDSDAWLSVAGEDSTPLANAFFGENVDMLARETDCGFVVAVHNQYTDLSSYRTVRAQFSAQIQLPPDGLETTRAIAAVLERRITLAGVESQPSDIFEHDALDLLVARFGETHNLRETVRGADWSVQHARADGSESVDRATMRKALTELE